jgi:hypothetical protein
MLNNKSDCYDKKGILLTKYPNGLFEYFEYILNYSIYSLTIEF